MFNSQETRKLNHTENRKLRTVNSRDPRSKKQNTEDYKEYISIHLRSNLSPC